jgi:hypothetical protein
MRRELGWILGATGLALAALATPSQLALAATAGTVVMGQVVSGGQPIPGAKVTLYAWPRQSVVAALKAGAVVPMRAIGSGTSTSSGRYAISVSNWKAVRASADGNVVNLEVIAVQGRRGASFTFPRLLTGAAGSWTLAVDSKAPTPDRAPQQAALSLRSGPSGPGSRPNFPPCGQLDKVKYLGKRWTIVGETASRVPGVKMDFTYGHGQNSSLGVGFSVSGAKGTWTADGTKSVSENGSQGFPTATGAITTLDKTEFKYWNFLEVCVGDKALPTGWAAGSSHGHGGAPNAAHCVSELAGSHFTKDTTTSWTFSSGVSLADIIGINLSAQTGYDATASVTYHFPQHRFLCGKNDDPGGAPGLLVAGLPHG